MNKLFLSVFGLYLSMGAFCQEKINSFSCKDSNFIYGKLANGFTYYIRNDRNSESNIEIRLVVKAGSSQEDSNQIEFAHVAEHAAFLGTKHFPGDSLKKFIVENGLVQNNFRAVTEDSYTLYFITIPKNNLKVLSTSIQIARDWAQDVTLDSAVIDHERGDVLAELKGGENSEVRQDLNLRGKIFDSDIMSDAFFSKRKQSLLNYSPSAIVNFYNEWYRPELEAIVIVGENIDVLQTEKLISQLFGDLRVNSNPKSIGLSNSKNSADIKGGHNLFILPVHGRREGSNVRIYFKQKADYIFPLSPGQIQNSYVEELFLTMLNVRLKTIVNHYNFECSNILAGLNREGLFNTLSFEIGFDVTNEAKIEVILFEMQKILYQIAKYGFGEDEFMQAKADFAKRADKYDGSPRALSYNYIYHFLNGKYECPIMLDYYQRDSIFASVNLKMVNKKALLYIQTRDNIGIGILTPESNKTSALHNAAIFKFLDSLNYEPLGPFKKEAKITELIVSEPNKVSTIKEIKSKSNYELDIKEFELSNKARILLKRFSLSSSEPGRIFFKGFGNPGFASSSNTNFIRFFAPGVILNAGGGIYNKFQLNQFLNDRNISISLSVQDNRPIIEGECDQHDFIDLMKLISLYCMYPRQDSSSFAEINARLKKNTAGSKYSIFDLANEVFPNVEQGLLAHPERYLIQEREVYNEFSKMFGGFSNWTFIVSGSFDNNLVLNSVNKYLSVPSKVSSKIIKDKESARKIRLLGQFKKTVREGNQTTANVSLFYPTVFDPTVKNNVIYDLVRQIWLTRMNDRLRYKEHETYFTSSPAFLVQLPETFRSFNLNFFCDTQKVQYMISAVGDENLALRTTGVNEQTVKNAKNQLLPIYITELNSPKWWSNYLFQNSIKGVINSDVLKKLFFLEIVTVEDVNKAYKQYLSETNRIIYITLPALPGSNKFFQEKYAD